MNKLSDIVIPTIEVPANTSVKNDKVSEVLKQVKELSDLFYYVIDGNNLKIVYDKEKFKQLSGMTLIEFSNKLNKKINDNSISSKEMRNIIKDYNNKPEDLRLINLNVFLKRKSEFKLNTQIKKELKNVNIKKTSISEKFLNSYKFANEGYIFNYSDTFTNDQTISDYGNNLNVDHYNNKIKEYIKHLDLDSYKILKYNLELEFIKIKYNRKIVELYKNEEGQFKFKLLSHYENFTNFLKVVVDSCIKAFDLNIYEDSRHSSNLVYNNRRDLLAKFLNIFLINTSTLSKTISNLVTPETREDAYQSFLYEILNDNNNYTNTELKYLNNIKIIIDKLNKTYDNVTDYKNYKFILSINGVLSGYNNAFDNLEIIYKILTTESENINLIDRVQLSSSILTEKQIILKFIKKDFTNSFNILPGINKIEALNTGDALHKYKYLKDIISDFLTNDIILFGNDKNDVINTSNLKYLNPFMYKYEFNIIKTLFEKPSTKIIDTLIDTYDVKNPLSRLFLFNTLDDIKLISNKDLIDSLFDETEFYEQYPLNEISKIMNGEHVDKFKLTRLNSLFYKVKKTDLNNILIENTQNILDSLSSIFNKNNLNIFLTDKNLFKYLNLENESYYHNNKISAETLLKKLSKYLIDKYDVNPTNIVLIDIYNYFSKEEFKVIVQVLALLSTSKYNRVFTEANYSDYLKSFILAVKDIIDQHKKSNSSTKLNIIDRTLYVYNVESIYFNSTIDFYYLFNTHVKYF